MSGIYSEEWLCSTIKETFSAYCDYSTSANTSDEDSSTAEEVTIEGVDLYGLKMAYYVVDEPVRRADDVFGEKQLEFVSRAFWFMGYITALPANVRTYQLQGIYGEDLVQVYVATAAFKYFSTYGGSDRNTAGTYSDITPRVGDIVYITNNEIFYEIVDVQLWHESFGTTSVYTLMTMRVYQNNKKIVSDNPTIGDDDPIRENVWLS